MIHSKTRSKTRLKSDWPASVPSGYNPIAPVDEWHAMMAIAAIRPVARKRDKNRKINVNRRRQDRSSSTARVFLIYQRAIFRISQLHPKGLNYTKTLTYNITLTLSITLTLNLALNLALTSKSPNPKKKSSIF